MRKPILLFVLLVTVSLACAAKVVKIPGILKPTTILIENDQLFITEAAAVYIYSLNDFSLQEKFGKQGQGPREFSINPMRGIRLNIQPDEILVDCTGKIVYYTREGNFKKEIRTPPIFSPYMPLGEKFVGIGIGSGKKGPVFVVNIYDANFKKEKEIHSVNIPDTGVGNINPVTFLSMPYLYTCEDKIFVGGQEEDIEMFDKSGKKLPPLIKDYKKVTLTEARKKEYEDFFKTSTKYKGYYERDKERIKYPDYFPIVRNFHVVDKKIYILTYREKMGKKEFLIYDISGKPLKTVFLPLEEITPVALYPYTIKNGKLYQLIDNPKTEEWELHITEIK